MNYAKHLIGVILFISINIPIHQMELSRLRLVKQLATASQWRSRDLIAELHVHAITEKLE